MLPTIVLLVLFCDGKNLVDVWMVGDGGARRGAEPRHEVYHTRRQASLLQQLPDIKAYKCRMYNEKKYSNRSIEVKLSALQ